MRDGERGFLQLQAEAVAPCWAGTSSGFPPQRDLLRAPFCYNLIHFTKKESQSEREKQSAAKIRSESQSQWTSCGIHDI